ncbi:hypothetical protein GCM10012275_07410 [Longimycelium tulufanense]|uniref:Uncharacterized protein n=1 Tax=Longimycelium tulufanense TaxID=907463 RepID=A0A8J3CAG6_9PSEU|nr:hypothetical protein [Longimycelium tulufanense]GGM39034.1 hypothetical protein GCM10012275_07410 [Longimycelium tulufanense]
METPHGPGESPAPPAPTAGRPLLPGLVLGTSAVLFVGVLLPWLHAEVRFQLPNVDIFDQRVDRFQVYESAANGLDIAEPWGWVTLLSALVAAAMAIVALGLQRSGLVTWAALPGGVAMIALLLVPLRMHEAGEHLTSVTDILGRLPGLGGKLLAVELSLAYGWYVSVISAAALLVVAFVAGRKPAPAPSPEQL